MPVRPTQYMLEHPLYPKEKPQEKEEDEKPESFGEIHCFMTREDDKKGKKLRLEFEEEDMCNIQDSQSEVSLNKTIEFNEAKPLQRSV